MKNILIAAVVLFSIDTRAVNLVENGDFESGVSGFTTDYSSYTNGVSATVCDAAEYGVSSSAYNIHPAWANTPDHTAAGSLYFIANGSADTSAVVWQSANAIVIDQAATAYRFEAWITSVYDVSAGAPGPELTFQVGNGSTWFDMGISQTFPNGYTPGEWRLSYYDGMFSEAGSYYIRLMNNQSAGGGNDLGIDDVYFGLSADAPSVGSNPVGETSGITVAPIPEPASALLIAVASGLLFGWRRFFGHFG
jgi:hypothetical protein